MIPKCRADGEQSLCRGVVKVAEKVVNTRTILGYGEGSSVLWKEVLEVFGCAPRVTLALQAQLSHPWGEGSPVAHCYAGLISLWLLRGLFLN